MIFDLREEDVYWCTADIGWVTGQLVHRVRATGQRRHRRHVRGHPRLPRQGPASGAIVEKYGVTILYNGADGHPHVRALGR